MSSTSRRPRFVLAAAGSQSTSDPSRSRPPQPRRSRVAGRWAVVASVLLVLAASVFMLLGVVVTTVTQTATSSGEVTTLVGSRDAVPTTLASVLFFAVPVGIAATPLLARRGRTLAIWLRTGAAVLLSLWVLFLAFGGGIFYFPAAGAMAVAAGLAVSTHG